jgi:NADPH-dependent curcumin reductase CurA
MKTYRRIVLASRPQGKLRTENLRMEDAVLPELKEGEVAVRNHYLSIDPYMRSRMDDVRSYAPPQGLDAVMIGATAGEVTESRHPDFRVGDKVVGMLGWSEMGMAPGQTLRKVGDSRVPLSVYLGAAGMPGITAWYGINRLLKPAAEETVLISAATGAVGSIAAQLARQRGCRVVGIAGGPVKCAYAVDVLGLDACVDHRLPYLDESVAQAAPQGIDAVFENVGGACLDAALASVNPHARIALCGLIAGYDGDSLAITQVRNLLSMRVNLQGFLITEHLEIWPQAIAELTDLIATGKLVYRESVAQGLEAAPQALMSLLQGQNLGKQLVKLT